MNFKLFIYRRTGNTASSIFFRLYGPPSFCFVFKSRISKYLFTTETADKKITAYLPIEVNEYGPKSYIEMKNLVSMSAMRAFYIQSPEEYEDIINVSDIYNVSFESYPIVKANILYVPDANFSNYHLNKEVKVTNIYKNYIWKDILVPYDSEAKRQYSLLFNGADNFIIKNILSPQKVVVYPEFPSNSIDKIDAVIDGNSYSGLIQSSKTMNGVTSELDINKSVSIMGYKDRILVNLDSAPQAIGLYYFIKGKVKEYIDGLRSEVTSEFLVEEYND